MRVLPISLVLILIACGKPTCESSHALLSSPPFGTDEYNLALMEQINSADDVAYWFDQYQEENGNEFITVDISGKELCTKAKLLVKDWDKKIAGIKQSKGMGYRGAELSGLKFEVIQTDKVVHLIYQGVDKIID